MAEEVENKQNIRPEKEGSKNKKYLRIFAVILAVIIGLILFFYAKENPDFPIGNIILIGSGTILLSIGIFNFYKLKDKLKGAFSNEYEDIPKPAKKEEIIDLLKNNAVCNEEYWNEVKRIISTTSEEISGYTIFNFKIEPLYQDDVNNYNIIYNANYPNELPTILPDANNNEVKQAMNKKSKKPKDEPNTEENIYFDENLQPKFRQTKKSKPNKQEKNKEELK